MLVRRILEQLESIRGERCVVIARRPELGERSDEIVERPDDGPARNFGGGSVELVMAEPSEIFAELGRFRRRIELEGPRPVEV